MPTEIAGEVLYTLKEVAGGLGVSYTTIKKMRENGELKATRVGREFRVKESEVKRLLNQNEEVTT
jgi:excisionase family DNA binding protein